MVKDNLKKEGIFRKKSGKELFSCKILNNLIQELYSIID